MKPIDRGSTSLREVVMADVLPEDDRPTVRDMGRELLRLRTEARQLGRPQNWADEQFERTFGAPPRINAGYLRSLEPAERPWRRSP